MKRINEIKEKNLIIYRQLELLINSIASYRLDEDSELDLAQELRCVRNNLENN